MRRATTLVLAGAVAVLAAAPAMAGGGAPQKKSVVLQDDFFQPGKLTVNRGSTITWRWPDEASDVHDVNLAKGPRGAKPFHSEPGAAGYTFKRRLTVPGTYRIICTLHPEEMHLTVNVRR